MGEDRLGGRGDEWAQVVPAPTEQFRRSAWRQFQRALDPLALPRPLPSRPRR